jgi:tetratricopeptide (TPR) repeat protein
MPSERSHPTAPLPVGETGRTMSSAFAELAELEYRLGDWPAAHASALESLRASQTAGLDQEAMASLVRLACIEAGLGRTHACRIHAAQATDLSRGRGASTAIEAMAGEAVGFLELGLDRVDAAIDRLERVAELSAQDPGACAPATTWASDLAEAYVRRGDHRSAEHALARLTNGSSGVTPGRERSAALLAGDHAYEPLFKRSLTWSARAQQPFEFARTQLCFGERLHRAGRRQEAGARVSAALDSFSSLGARPWAVRARRLLGRLSELSPDPSVGPRHLHGRPVGADLGPRAAQLGRVEAERNHRVGSLALGLFD